MRVNAWGRLQAPQHDVETLSDRAQVPAQIAAASAERPGLAYGLGRSYGDVCLNPEGLLWKAAALDHYLAFDDATGILRCEAGVSLRDIQRLFVPRGWSLPVVPGTQLVTVGGAIANDVHGKNHHVAGTFGDHVRCFTLARTDGSVREHAPGDPMFAATVGGLGLTGVIVDAELQLKRMPGPWLTVETLPYRDLDEFFALADASEAGWEHTVSWIDCLHGEGRSIFMRAHPSDIDQPAPPPRAERRVPLVPPVSLVNRLSLKPFNALAGLGVGLISVIDALEDLKTGRIVAPFGMDVMARMPPDQVPGFYLVLPKSHRRDKAVASFCRWIEGEDWSLETGA